MSDAQADTDKHAPGAFRFRPPTIEDGKTLWSFVDSSPILDDNSPYAYLLVCSHFSQTSIIAEDAAGNFAGYIAAYRRPDALERLFVWQIAVAPEARGQGLARRMLVALAKLPACNAVTHLEATVTPSNTASRRLFRSFAEHVGAPCRETPCFAEHHFPDNGHEAEEAFLIGPFHPKDLS